MEWRLGGAERGSRETGEGCVPKSRWEVKAAWTHNVAAGIEINGGICKIFGGSVERTCQPICYLGLR